MTELFADSAVSALVAATIKASALLGFATVVQAMLHRRASAATCHLVWTLAIGSVLLLPLASIMLPRWAVVVPTRATAAEVAEARAGTPVQTASPPMPSGASVEHVPAAEQASGVPWSIAMGVAYLAGVLVMLIRLARQRLAMRQFARGATAVSDARWTRLLRECACRMGVVRPLRLLRSRVPSVPLAFGIRRPSIVVPDMADTWPDDRCRAVILHELAHVARHDCLTQTVASAACAIYWFHPAAWWVARRMRIERELACDDRVIAAGTVALVGAFLVLLIVDLLTINRELDAGRESLDDVTLDKAGDTGIGDLARDAAGHLRRADQRAQGPGICPPRPRELVGLRPAGGPRLHADRQGHPERGGLAD